MKKIVLMDGHSILNRAFYGLPILSNSKGVPTNAIYGFLNILFKILEEEQPEYLTVAFDVHAPTFRHKMYAEYKGTRKPMPEELRTQVPLIKEMLQAMDIAIIEQAGYEADDILGTIAKRAQAQNMEAVIVSGDRDLLQIADEHIKIRIPKTKKTGTEIEDYNIKEVQEKYKVTPTEFIDLKALMGDSSDNVPGVPGIGEKTAMAIISTYKSIENAYEHIEEIKPNRARENLREYYEQAKFSKELVTICTEAEISYEIDGAQLKDMYTPKAYELCKEYEFKNFYHRFEGKGSREEAPLWQVQILEDFPKADALFSQMNGRLCGFQYVMSGNEIKALVLTNNGKDIYYVEQQGFFTEDYFTQLLGRLAKQHEIAVTFDLKTELPFIQEYRQTEEKLRDISIAAYLLNPLKSEYTYDQIAQEYLERVLPSKEDLFGKMKLEKAWLENQENIVKYFTNMAGTAYHTFDKLMEALKEQKMIDLYEHIEMPLVFTLYDMEQAGVKIEAEELRKYGEELKIKIREMEEEIYREAGTEFNINSPKQLGEVLFETLKLPNGKKTKTGYSTAAEVLEKLAPDYPIVSKILEYRQYTKLNSTYAEGLVGCIGEDGRIHSKFNQTITATGRLSSTEPNLQNIPIRMELGRQIRKVFVPKENYVLIDADYSQIELRVLAHMSKDENLIQAYKMEEDIHRITASQVFHIPFEEVTPLQRRNAKAVNFGIVYGISSFGLSEDLSISRKEAQEYIEQYFATYPGVKKFLDALVAEAKETGSVTTMFGRKRPIPELKSSNFMQRSFGERVAMNSPIQGTAADIIKIAMIRVDKRLRESNLQSRLILQVHDELLIEAKAEEVEQVKEILNEEMHHAANLSVPLDIDMNCADNWYDAH